MKKLILLVLPSLSLLLGNIPPVLAGELIDLSKTNSYNVSCNANSNSSSSTDCPACPSDDPGSDNRPEWRGSCLELTPQVWGENTIIAKVLWNVTDGKPNATLRTRFENTMGYESCYIRIVYAGGPAQIDGEPSEDGSQNFFIKTLPKVDEPTEEKFKISTMGYPQLATLVIPEPGLATFVVVAEFQLYNCH